MKVDAPQDVDLENNAKKLIIVKEVNECRVYDATLYAGGGIWCLKVSLAGFQSVTTPHLFILGGKGILTGFLIDWTDCTRIYAR